MMTVVVPTAKTTTVASKGMITVASIDRIDDCKYDRNDDIANDLNDDGKCSLDWDVCVGERAGRVDDCITCADRTGTSELSGCVVRADCREHVGWVDDGIACVGDCTGSGECADCDRLGDCGEFDRLVGDRSCPTRLGGDAICNRFQNSKGRTACVGSRTGCGGRVSWINDCTDCNVYCDNRSRWSSKIRGSGGGDVCTGV